MRRLRERAAGRLELAGARARALFGGGTVTRGSGRESTGTEGRAPDETDARLLAARIRAETSIGADGAAAIATDIVERARQAVARLDAPDTDANLTEEEALALESVIHVRGRPALRVLGNRLESLEHHAGSEFWQTFIADYEQDIVQAAAATGAAIANVPSSGYPAWVQGSAWLIADNRVVTNRHVLVSQDLQLVESNGPGSATRLRAGHAMTIEFAADNGTPATQIRHRVTKVLYLAGVSDPVDIAVLAIEPAADRPKLTLAADSTRPRNIFVVGHPAPVSAAPDAVKAVFGNPDGRKRVSFGKRLDIAPRPGELGHDASTIGGYSGGPVVGISDGTVAGLHYYGDPVGGNLAITAEAIRAHSAYQYW